MAKELAGYSNARNELTMRIESITHRMERTGGEISSLHKSLEYHEESLQADQELLDGYQRILALIPEQISSID